MCKLLAFHFLDDWLTSPKKIVLSNWQTNLTFEDIKKNWNEMGWSVWKKPKGLKLFVSMYHDVPVFDTWRFGQYRNAILVSWHYEAGDG